MGFFSVTRGAVDIFFSLHFLVSFYYVTRYCVFETDAFDECDQLNCDLVGKLYHKTPTELPAQELRPSTDFHELFCHQPTSIYQLRHCTVSIDAIDNNESMCWVL